MKEKGVTLRQTLADILLEANPFSLFLILILLLLAFGKGDDVTNFFRRILNFSPKEGE